LATAIAANKRMMLEINDELKFKKEDLAKNVTVLYERKEVMETNIARLEKIYEDCERLQMEYEDFKKEFN
ncbi:MAG: hypothetical protein II495_00195, partial [Paludibacteraceae bacterium]|nr:hypothetical protein [Paludibacteraceae bacterium]